MSRGNNWPIAEMLLPAGGNNSRIRHRRPAARFAALAVALALIAGPLDAAVIGVTVGTTAAQVLAAPTTRAYRLIIIRNQSGSATISCAPGNSSPAIGAAGAFDIAPGAAQSWAAAGVVFADAWYCIASAANTPITVQAE